MKKFYIAAIIAASFFIANKGMAQVTCHAGFYLDLTRSTAFSGVLVNTSTSTGVVSPNEEVYVWSWGDGTATWGVKLPTHTYSSPGTKTIFLTIMDAYKSCSDSIAHTITIDSTGSFHKTNQAFTLSVVAPTPQGITSRTNAGFAQLNSTIVTNSADFTFNGLVEGQMVSLNIYSADGKQVASNNGSIYHNAIHFDASSLQNGIYIANLTVNGQTMTLKFVKN
jgi:hypothetical protein